MIADERYTDAYMLNWRSNVFPGVLGRTCDRPCEPACRRGRLEEKPVAICRLKRVTADFKGDITDRLPKIPVQKNGKKIACIGAGPASLTVARDLAPLGYEIVIYDQNEKGGGFMRSQIPSFRLPESVLDEEVDFILNFGIETKFGVEVNSLAKILEQKYDAIFIGTGAPRGKELSIPGREAADEHIHIGINWLSSVSFAHTSKIGKKVIVIGGGNTAMDCCRTSLRLGADEVKVVVRSGFEEMKASDWEKEDAINEGIPIFNYHSPKSFVLENGKLVGMTFELVRKEYDAQGKRQLIPTGEPDVTFECDDVLLAIGQENTFPWIERGLGIEFDKWDMPVLNEITYQSSLPQVFIGGDAAFGPKNIITAVAHGHQAAISIDAFCNDRPVDKRPDIGITLVSQKMGVHEWSYDNHYDPNKRNLVPHAKLQDALRNIKLEVELGFDEEAAFKEAARCLNCDVQTIFSEKLCIECDACVDICPLNCIDFTADAEEEVLRQQLRVPANNLAQDLYVSAPVATGRVMVKDEDLCVHCGLCSERCPTAAWDMQKSILDLPQAGY